VGIYNKGGSCRNAVRLSFIVTTPTACILFTEEVVVAIVSLSLSLPPFLSVPQVLFLSKLVSRHTKTCQLKLFCGRGLDDDDYRRKHASSLDALVFVRAYALYHSDPFVCFDPIIIPFIQPWCVCLACAPPSQIILLSCPPRSRAARHRYMHPTTLYTSKLIVVRCFLPRDSLTFDFLLLNSSDANNQELSSTIPFLDDDAIIIILNRCYIGCSTIRTFWWKDTTSTTYHPTRYS